MKSAIQRYRDAQDELRDSDFGLWAAMECRIKQYAHDSEKLYLLADEIPPSKTYRMVIQMAIQAEELEGLTDELLAELKEDGQ